MSNFQRKLNKRKNKYKSKTNKQDSLMKRVGLVVQLSKNRRDQKLSNKRILISSFSQIKPPKLSEWERVKLPHKNQLYFMKNDLESNDDDLKKKTLCLIRRMITVEDNPPLSFVIASGIIENIVNFAENSTDPYILFESCWIICNVASGSTTYTQTLFRYNIVNIFANLLKTKNTAVFELVVWAFGNLAGGEMKYRELILENDNVLSRILSYSSILNPPDSLITIVCWSLSNLVNVNNRTHQNQVIN
ncbi:importin subunit alpha-8 [Anaeramoeba flamelloides]|uniref:Importin subunit alpha-8 n=1 Tax=Anaeramoeba flamelloides TaxID=1746091 RepID=A0AAV7YFN1_9EUKA|nr:importin subunit alpha-8 [Anaeramoeba flamelloides]KAJ6247409.1 importin subunit alpha-8 [Anaeramoeba flamelloides]